METRTESGNQKPIWTILAMLFANFILRIPQLLGSLEAWIQIFLILFFNLCPKILPLPPVFGLAWKSSLRRGV
ncbi:hypothetical protein SERLADRAFT_399338, partial [Serpula lacrymans var. lacrymans S7.9]